MVKKYLLRLVLLSSFIALFFNKASAQYASQGTAPNGTPNSTPLTSGNPTVIHSIYWLTWGDVNPNTGTPSSTSNSTLQSFTPFDSPTDVYQSGNVIDGDYTWLFSPTVQIIAHVRNRTFTGGTTSLSAYTPGTFFGNQSTQFGDQLDNMFNANGLTGSSSKGVENSGIGVSGIVTFDIAIEVKIVINGQPQSVDYPGMVLADAESLVGNGSGQIEYISADTDPLSPTPLRFQLIAKSVESNNPAVNDYKLRLSNGGKSFKLFVDGPLGDLGVGAVMFAHGSKSFKNVSMEGNGFTAVGVGFVLPFDLGDNPQSFGYTGNYINDFVTQPVFSNDGDYSIADVNYAPTALIPQANVYIGDNNVDPDGPMTGSDASTIDDLNKPNSNDENTLTPAAIAAMPVVKVNQASDIVISGITATNNSNPGAAATLYAWLDLNSDGKYSGNEVKTVTVPAGSSNVTIPGSSLTYANADIKNLLKVGPLHARFRISTTPLTNTNNSDLTLLDTRSTTFAADGETEDYKLQDITGVTIAGTIFDDGNGNADNAIAGTATPATLQTVGGNQLYAYLADNSATHVIIDRATVAADGTYSFTNANNGTYTVAISTVNLPPLDGTKTLADVPATLGNTAIPSGASYGINNGSHTAGEIQISGTPNLQISVVATPATNANVTAVNFGINLRPVAVDDPSATTSQNNSVDINVPSNDTDPDGTINITTVQLVDPNNAAQRGNSYSITPGTFTVNPTTGVVTFQSNGNFTSGTATIQYTIKDNLGLESAPATITVTFSNVPTGVHDTQNTTINTPVTSDLRVNDSDHGATVKIVGGANNGTTGIGTLANGTISVDPTTQLVTYTPPSATFTGIDQYQYTITNNNGTSAPIVVDVQVALAGANDTYTTDISTISTEAVKLNDGTNAQPNTVTVTNVTLAAHGTVSAPSATGVITYTPTAGYIGTDTYTYTLTSNGATSAPVTVTINIIPPGSSDTYTTDVGTPSTESVKLNDGSNAQPNTVTVTNVTIPAHGTVSAPSATGVITYTPTAGYIGTDTYTYTLTSNGATSAPITVTINIIPPGSPDTYTTDVGTPSTEAVKLNDGSNAQPNTVTVTNVTIPAHGTVSAPSATGVITYTPTAGYIGTDTYTYTLTSNSATSAPITVTINIIPPGVADDYTTNVSTPSTEAVKLNDGSNAQPNTVTVTNVTTPAHGTVSAPSATGVITYTPTAGYIGNDTYTYTLTSNGATSAPITVTVHIITSGSPDSYNTNVNVLSTETVKLNDGAANQADAVTVAIATPPVHGTVTNISTSGVISYSPATDYIGTDSYTYTLTNNGSVSAPINVNITINPTGTDDNYSTAINTPSLQDIKTNDGSYAQSSSVIIAIPVLPLHGTTSINQSTGIVTYTPNTNYTGPDTYKYTLTANGLTTAQLTVTINVSATGVDDVGTTNVNTQVNTDVKANDGGAGTGATVSIATPPAHGTILAIDPTTGVVTYKPNQDFVGTDTYQYNLTNGSTTNGPVNVTINVKPVGVTDPYTINVNDQNTLEPVKNNDGTSAAPDAITVTNVTLPAHGVINSISASGVVTYTPTTDYVGTDTYTYRLNAGSVQSDPITVNINIRPVAQPDAYTTPVNTNSTETVKNNDGSSAQPNTVVVNVITQPTNGTILSISAAGVITYKPNTDYVGPDGYSYTLTAGGVTSAPVLVAIGVRPVGTNDNYTTPINTQSSEVVKVNDGVSAQPNAVTVAIATQPAHGTITSITSSGTVVYTPNTDYVGNDTYTYTLTAGGVPSTPVTATIVINPTGADDSYTTPVSTSSTEAVKINDGTYAQAGSVTVTNVTIPAHGTVSAPDANGVLTYTPNTGFVGIDSYTYKLTANGVTSAPINVTVTITATSNNGTPDAYSTNVSIPVTYDVRINDGPANANATVTPTNGTHGLTSVDANGKVVYSPAAGYIGTDTYTYTLTNNGVTSGPILVTVTIKPVGTPDNGTTPVNTPITTDVKANDGTLPAGTTVTTTFGSHGVTAVDPATGRVTYTPVGNFVGTDTYTYTLTTPGGIVSDPVTVTINVVAGSLTFTKVANNTFSKAGDAIIYTFTITNTGTLGINNIVVADPGVDPGTIKPAAIASIAAGASATVTAQHTATAADVSAGFFANQASLTGTDVNGNPVVKPKSDDPGTPAPDDPTIVRLTAAPGSPNISITKTGTVSDTYITYNFVIRNTGTSTLTSITLTDAMLGLTNAPVNIPAGGLLPNVGTGYSAKYTLTQANIDAGSVTNVASTTGTDAAGGIATASASVTNTTPKAPVATPDNAAVGTNSATIIKVLNNDPTADPIVPGTIEIVTQPKHGTVKVNADGTITYVPNPGYSGPDSFTYRGKDARGFYTNNAEVAISVGFVPAFAIPTLFTPNGDGVNDAFEIRGLSANYPNNELIIVNRWGNEVFRQTNYDSKWTGEGLNEGTYYYLLHIKNTDGSDIQVIKGWVTLLRSTK